MNKATIADLQVNYKQKLNNTAKRRLETILEDEFSNQTTVLNADITSVTQKVVDEWKKEKGYTKRIDALKKAQDVVDRAHEKLLETGLDEHGNIVSGKGTYIHGNYVAYPEGPAKELQARIDKATVQLRQPRNCKNKIISRIWMADTMGEACVIMNEVLGNGLIPTLDKKDLLALPEPESK